MRKGVILLALAAISCGGAQKSVYVDAYSEAPVTQTVYGGAPAPADMEDQDYAGDRLISDEDYKYAEMEEVTLSRPMIGRSGSSKSISPPEPEPERTDIGKLYKAQKESTSNGTTLSGPQGSGEKLQAPETPSKSEATPDTKVVYTGHLALRVKRLMEAVEEITKITQDKGGYIQSLSGHLMIVRVPALDFDAVMTQLASVGTLLDKRIESMDVTEFYTDLRARLEVAKETRERLIVLLEKEKDVKERIKIVEEITRLSDQIESLEATLESLQNLIEYFTIYIELQPVLDNTSVQRHRSPFSWIRNLVAHRTTIFDGRRDVEMDLPKGFVLFDDTEEYRAQASDTTLIRVGLLDNEPLGDNDFWADAVKFEMEARDEELTKEGSKSGLAYILYKSRDLKPRYYLIALQVVDDELFVVEVFFPDDEAFGAHGDSVMKALETFEVK